MGVWGAQPPTKKSIVRDREIAVSAQLWSWLLGRTPGGAWRYTPYQASRPGPGSDPSSEARVEVIRRLIAYPEDGFQAVLGAISGLSEAKQEVRWTCYRSPGQDPARPYWICFLTEAAAGRRFHFGLELLDRSQLNLWIFSGYDPEAVPEAFKARFGAGANPVDLPRLTLVEGGDLSIVRPWIQAAWEDQLAFQAPSPEVLDPGTSADLSSVIDDSISMIVAGESGRYRGLAPRSSRARLVIEEPRQGGEAKIRVRPLSRLSTEIGRDLRSDLAIEHATVSGDHCILEWREGNPGLEDRESKNGTRLNGVKLEPGVFTPIAAREALIEIGDVRCLFIRDLAIPGEVDDHPERLGKLVAKGRLTEAQIDEAIKSAPSQGLSEAEFLIRRGTLSILDWARPSGPGAGCAVSFLIWLLPLFFLSGCGHTFGFLPPAMEWDMDPAPMREGNRRVEWESDVGLKPLVQVRTHEEEDRSETHFLFPLGLHEESPNQSIYRLYPIFQHYERVDPDGFPDSDTIVFPLFLTGSHPVEGNYFYLFPFGGTLKGLLGKDEAAGVLFPLYGWARNGENESHHVLWPLISWSYGGGTEGFRFLPFFSHFEKTRPDGEVAFNRTSILWPFINYAEEATNSRNPYHSIFLFPFWGKTRSGWMDDNTILWPLFRWWHDKRTDYREYRVPFPFFIYGSGPDHFRLDFWPLYGYRKRGGYTRHFWLWPIGRYEHQTTEEYDDTRVWLLPLLWTHDRTYKDAEGKPTGEEDVKRHLWPLIRWESKRDGSADVRFPALLWFSDPQWNFETILAPLWRLFRYQRDSQGYEELTLLLGLYHSQSSPKGEQRWDILGGLVGRSTSPAGNKTRLFWFLEF
jgi:FHA domain-containing protein